MRSREPIRRGVRIDDRGVSPEIVIAVASRRDRVEDFYAHGLVKPSSVLKRLGKELPQTSSVDALTDSIDFRAMPAWLAIKSEVVQSCGGSDRRSAALNFNQLLERFIERFSKSPGQPAQ